MEYESIEIEIEMTDEEFLIIAKAAHEKNLTFNRMCCKVLEDFVENYGTDGFVKGVD